MPAFVGTRRALITRRPGITVPGSSVVGTRRHYHNFGEVGGPYSRTGIDVGAVDASKIIAVQVTSGGTSGTVSCTINGVTPTHVVTSAASTRVLDYFEINDSSATADVVVTHSATGSRCAVEVWTIIGQAVPGYTASSGTAPTAVASGTSAPPGAIAGALIIASAFQNPSTGSISWAQDAGSGTRYADEQVGSGVRWSTYATSSGGTIALTPSYVSTALLWRSLAVGYS